jgi:hypothetical protein
MSGNRETRRRILWSTTLAIGTILEMLAGSTHAQQVPIPQTVAEVPGPVPGTAMTKEYVQTVGRSAYFWGYALVATSNRRAAFAKAPERILLGGAVPMAPVEGRGPGGHHHRRAVTHGPGVCHSAHSDGRHGPGQERHSAGAQPSGDVSLEPVRWKDEDRGLEQTSIRPGACRSA